MSDPFDQTTIGVLTGLRNAAIVMATFYGSLGVIAWWVWG